MGVNREAVSLDCSLLRGTGLSADVEGQSEEA